MLAALAPGASVAGAAERPPSVGDPAPLFVLPRVAPRPGEPSHFVLRAHVGPEALTPASVVALAFLAPWSEATAPYLERLAHRADRPDVLAVGILIEPADPDDAVIRQARRAGVVLVSDPHRVLTRRFDVDAVPLTVLVDGEGRVGGRHAGAGPEAWAALEAPLALEPVPTSTSAPPEAQKSTRTGPMPRVTPPP